MAFFWQRWRLDFASARGHRLGPTLGAQSALEDRWTVTAGGDGGRDAAKDAGCPVTPGLGTIICCRWAARPGGGTARVTSGVVLLVGPWKRARRREGSIRAGVPSPATRTSRVTSARPLSLSVPRFPHLHDEGRSTKEAGQDTSVTTGPPGPVPSPVWLRQAAGSLSVPQFPLL